MLKQISGTYEIIGKIGEGNSGEIYKAYNKNLRKEVVLKKIKTEIKDIVNNRSEVDVLKNLRHSCLPQVLDFFEMDGDVYTAMDYIPGKSFKQYLDSGTKFKEKHVITWAKQISATLEYLHRQIPPIIHSDLKPANIMLMPDGNICLIDFNISASLDGNSAWVTGYTSGYSAPEQIAALKYNQNELDQSRWKTIDARADIYSLGATLYHLMTGTKPKLEEDGTVADIRDSGTQINAVFAAIIMKCLEKEPSKRYQSARELMADLVNIGVKDERYRRLIRKQRMLYTVAVVLMVCFTGMAVMGYFRMGTEKRKAYEMLVRKEAECITTGDLESFEGFFQKAVRLDPVRLDAYYQKAIALNRQRQYGDAIEFINSEILGNEELLAQKEDLNNIYYVLGNSYDGQGDYQQAALCYEKAIEIRSDNSDYYRDYAISLAYGGNLQGAKAALEQAKKQKLNSIEINYVEGEILYNTQDYNGAQEIFLKCIEDASDDYIKMRAYIMAGKCIDGLGDTIENIDQKLQLFENARQELPVEYNIGVLEQLAQSYSQLAKATGEEGYSQKAVSVFEQIESQGMGSYDTSYNLAVLYQNMQDYDKAADILHRMLTDYGDNYRTYKSLAFLEVARQGRIDNSQRNYSPFQQYYQKAEELYQLQLQNNITDVEMDRLAELYQEAADLGWIQK
ncbi:protein kinase [Blautia schinkii]|nr:protein kinase [Blautia schinkii]